MQVEITKKDQIKDLYSQLKEKTKFIELVAKKVNRSPKSLRNHWFSEFWSIPEEYQQTVIDELNKTLLNQ